MKKLGIFIFALSLNLILIKQVYSQEKHRVYELPAKYVSFILANDQKCPLQLSNPRFLDYEKGTFQKVYTISNTLDKSVKSFQIKELSWFGNQEYTKGGKSEDILFFQPYESFSTLEGESELEFVNFDEKSATKLRLSEHPKNIWIILVTKVEMSNGKTYDITSEYKTIEKYVQNLKISSKMSVSEINIKEKELRDFIRKTLDK